MTELVNLELEERGETVIARLTGELDISSASVAGERIGEAVPPSARALVIDFTELEFIDSSGVAMLFALARRLAGRRQVLRVVAPSGGPVQRVLQLVEFERAAPLDDDLGQALAAVG